MSLKNRNIVLILTSYKDVIQNMNNFYKGLGVRIMVYNATFNNISVISWRSVLLLEKTTDLLQVADTVLSHNVASSTNRPSGIRTDVIGDRQ